MSVIVCEIRRACLLTLAWLSILQPSCPHARCLVKATTRTRTASICHPTRTVRLSHCRATTALLRQLASNPSHLYSTSHQYPTGRRLGDLRPGDSMCWITLTPTRNKTKPNRASSDCSSAEIVRVRHSPKPRFSDLSISLPSTVSSSPPPPPHHHHHHDDLHIHIPEHLRPHAPLPHGILQHHHRHPHLHPIHPLHLHPLTPLHGSGKKIRIAPFCSPPPPTRDASRCRDPAPAPCASASSSASASGSAKKEPVYRTQIVEPAAVRAETGRLLRDARDVRARGRMRRVGGYEVLGKSVPWDWDCVSSTVGSSVGGGKGHGGRKGKRKGGLKYPPFGGVGRWM